MLAPVAVPHNSLRAVALRSDKCGKSEHEACVSFGTQASGEGCASRHGHMGGMTMDSRTANILRAIAALGIGSRYVPWPSNAMACPVSTPVYTPAMGALRAGSPAEGQDCFVD